MFIYLKWRSDQPLSTSFRVKATFPFWSSDRNQWAVVVSRTSISGIDTESGLYPEWGWLWGIRSSRQINEHSQFVELTFSKSSIWWGGTLELTFHMSICGLSTYLRISAYPHTLCGFFYAVSCVYAYINLHKPQSHMRVWKTTACPPLLWTPTHYIGESLKKGYG